MGIVLRVADLNGVDPALGTNWRVCGTFLWTLFVRRSLVPRSSACEIRALTSLRIVSPFTGDTDGPLVVCVDTSDFSDDTLV